MNNSVSEPRRLLLLATVLIISVSGLAYQLVSATMATYLMGNSVLQFSFASGWFMASMGLGSYLSRFTKHKLFAALVRVQIVLSIVGGFSATFMFFAFAHTETLYPVFMVLALIIGTGIGFEIPIILRILNEYRALSVAVSDIFTWDYLGALITSAIFPLFVLPHLGLLRSSIFFGLLNLGAGVLVNFLSPEKIPARLKIGLMASSILLIASFFGAEFIDRFIEKSLYDDPVLMSRETSYQKVVVTRWKDDVRLYLNGNIQFSTRDEFRYHETLVHTPISFMKKVPRNILILGGGDGMAIREALKYKDVKKITLLELDPEVIKIFKSYTFLRKLNESALHSPKVEIIINDAFSWLKENKGKRKFDFIIADLPDPNSYSLGKLYSVSFYHFVFMSLSKSGLFITQATSSTFAPEAFWSIEATLSYMARQQEKMRVVPLHAYLPSFGDWGFVMVLKGEQLSLPYLRDVQVRYLTKETIISQMSFSKDILSKKNNIINRLNNQQLVKLYNDSYHYWY